MVSKMKRLIKKLFNKQTKTKESDLVLENSEKTLDMFLSMMKESRTLGHVSPDYALKATYRKRSLELAQEIIDKNDAILPPEVILAMHFIVDYNRLIKENKPVPEQFVVDKITEALNVVLEIRYGKD